MTIRPEVNSTAHKNTVVVATTASITLSGAQTIDGVAVVAGDRVLVKNQATASQNGIYVVAAGAWSRAKDADQAEEVRANIQLAVSKGTTQADSVWMLTTDDPIVIGTTALAFAQVGGSGAGLSGATPVAVDTAAGAAGSAGLGSRADHKHSITTAAPVAVGDLSNVEGTALALARADHVHRANIRAQNAGSYVASEPTINNTGSASFTDDAGNDRLNFNAARVTMNAPTSLAVGDSAAVGASDMAAADDHVHAFPAPAAPADVTKAAASAGAATTVARADHKHDVSTAAPSAVGTANAEGAATSLSRSDHVHDHGTQSTSTHHAVAVSGGNNGFLSGTDKQKLDNVGTAFAAIGQTTDATITTLATYTPADDTVVSLLVRVAGRNNDTGLQGGGYLLSATFRKLAGAVTQVGTTTALAAHEEDAAWDAAVDASGGDVRVRVTGAAATTIDWTCHGLVTLATAP